MSEGERVDEDPLRSRREGADLAHRHEDEARVAANEEPDRLALVRWQDDLLDVAEVPVRQVDTEFLAVSNQVVVRPKRLGFVCRARIVDLEHLATLLVSRG
jgi:hypothetical protein